MAIASHAAPMLLNYRGNIAVNARPFEGKGWFAFAIVDTRGTILWASGDSPAAGQTNIPNGAITLHVQQGNYSVRLGDTSQRMPALDDVTLRGAEQPALQIWFHDGTHGWQVAGNKVPLGPTISNAAAIITVSNKPRSSPDAVMEELRKLRSRVGRGPMPPALPGLASNNSQRLQSRSTNSLEVNNESR